MQIGPTNTISDRGDRRGLAVVGVDRTEGPSAVSGPRWLRPPGSVDGGRHPVLPRDVEAAADLECAALDRPGRAVLVHDAHGRLVRSTVPLGELTGLDGLSSDGRRGWVLPDGWRLVGVDGRPLAAGDLPRARAMRTGREQVGVAVGLQAPDGAVRWLRVTARPVLGDGPEPVAVVSAVADAEGPTGAGGGAVGAAEELDELAAATEEVARAVLVVDEHGTVVHLDDGAQRLYGVDASACGRAAVDVATWDLPRRRVAELLADRETSWSGRVWARRGGGVAVPVHLTVAPIVGADGRGLTVAVAVEVARRGASTDALVDERLHDDLTGLPDRRLFFEGVRRTVARHDHRRGPVAVAMLDLDDFHVINDAFVHAAGDLVIAHAGRALAAVAHKADVVARLSGATFAVCCTHLGRHADVGAYADRLREAVSGTLPAGCPDQPVRWSAGIATSTAVDDDPDELLQRADLALSRAKATGKARSWVYDETLRRRLQRELEVEAAVRSAIQQRAVDLAYQPVVRIRDGVVVGAEALLRLRDGAGQVVPALEAVGVAERHGLIGDLGLLIIETACRDAAGWQRERPEGPLAISVNVSARQLDDPDLPAKVGEVLAATGLEPARLNLEMTETVLMEDSVRSAGQLAQLKRHGVSLSADDFGTGYSSLAYLKRFPLDVIKADLSFVAGLPDSPEDVAVIGAIVGVADALGLLVVAEGVERAAQAEALEQLGCAYGQGLMWSWAVPASELVDTVRRVERRAGRTAAAELVHPSIGRGPVASVATDLDRALGHVGEQLGRHVAAIDADPALGDEARAATGELARVVRRLDVLAALDAGNLAVGTDPVDVAAVVAAACARRVRDDVPVSWQLLAVGPVSASGDAALVQLALEELLDNAVGNSPSSGAVLALVDRRPGWIEVAVHDAGPGIPAPLVGHAFRRFGRLEDRAAGTGLGLHLARGIARAHGGDVVHRGRREQAGSVFVLRLPAGGTDSPRTDGLVRMH